jgi:hypothetical protein
MSKKSALISLLSDRPVAYHPDLARILGGVKQAIFVSQLLYWTGKGKRPDGFIWKTQAEWTDETGLSAGEQRTARKHLVEQGILQEKLKGIPAKLHYKLDLDKLQASIEGYYEQDMTIPHNLQDETPPTIPESTSESTDRSAAFSAATQGWEKAATVQLVDVTDSEITCPNPQCDESLILGTLHKSECRCPHCRQPLWIKDVMGVAAWKPPQKYRTTKRQHETVGDIIPEIPRHLAPFQANGNKRKLLELWGKNRDVVIDSLEWARNKVTKNEMQASQAVRNALTAAERKISVMVEPAAPEPQILGYDPNITPEWMQ